MNASGRDLEALRRLVRPRGRGGATADDLQSLLLQVVFALLMIFMIAYFIFVGDTKKKEEEQILDLNRQKLVVALERVSENRRIRYGLNALMTQGVDGKRVFDADDHVKDGALSLAPAALAAFSSGSAAAFSDYADPSKLAESWKSETLGSAGLDGAALTQGETEWLDAEIASRSEQLRLDARGVQRSLASRLQKAVIENPASLEGIADAGAIADEIKARSLKMVEDAIGSEVLP
ncbi:MAG: hypothetical protein K6F50_05040 [Kiritimatiellae bacterium]|nr:hypothetical protein [Kiritimatiellia bacterium]